MRFTNLFTLLVASSALAYNIPMKRDEFQDEAQKLGQVFDAANIDASNSSANQDSSKPTNTNENLTVFNIDGCGDAIKEMAKCFDDSIKEADGQCKKFNSDECKAVLKTDFSSSCKEFDVMFGTMISAMSMSCAVDEKGKYCPIAVTQQNKKEFTDKEIQETCKSKACTDNAVESLTKLKSNIQVISGTANVADFDKYISTLKEEKCTAAAKSGASQIKVGGALLLTLALVLSYF